MRLVTTFIQNTESTDPDLSYLNRARFILSVADGHGADGVGILDAVIRNRHLFLSMTSGAEIDAGSVFTEDDLPVASDSRLGIAAFDPAYFSILAGKVTLRDDLDFGLNETQLAEYLTANKYATQAWVAAQGFIGSDGLALYATRDWVLGQNFAKASSLNNYLLKSVWDEVFEITTENGVRVLNVKMDIAGLKGISAYGLGSTSGGSASGSLGELVNVGEWADEVPAADRVMVQLAGATHWSAKPLSALVGLDTAALTQYLTENSYLKAGDISSYLTWANLSGKPTVYPTNWANIADRPTVYPTTWTSVTGRPTKLSQFTDDVVSGNYLPKPTWDAVFEVVTVDGTPTLKVKYDILGLKGITAYSDGTLSGGFSGALVDLVDVAVTNLASGDILKYNGTHFVNVPVSSIAGASSWDQITGKPDYFPTRWADVSGAPTSLPASDVYPWAKASTKPTYTAAEVGALALSGGTLTGTVQTIGSFILANSGAYPQLTFRATADNSERLLFRHGNDLKWRYNGTNDGIIYHSGNFNPDSKFNSLYNVNDSDNVTGNGYTLKELGGTVSGPFLKWGTPGHMFEFFSGNRINEIQIRHMSQGVWGNPVIMYHSGNFNPSSKLDKSVWDEAFELKTVNGVRVISAKLDFLSVAGISAYATGPSSGGGGGGLDYDLLKQALTGAITPDGYPFTISTSFLGAIDKTYLTSKLANTYADKVHTHLWADITDRPTSLPASDVYPWAKAATKPTYTAAEVGALPLSGGVMSARGSYPQLSMPMPTSASGDSIFLHIGVSGDSNVKLRRYNATSDSFSELSLSNTGLTAILNGVSRTIYHSGNFDPDSKLGVSSVAVEAKKMSYQGLMTAISGTTIFPAGLYLYGVYNNGYPVAYGNLLRVGGSGLGEMLFGWAGDASVGGLYYRSKRDVVATAWSSWCKLWTSANFNPDNYLLKTANAVSASKWATARVLTLTGSAAGSVSIDGSANVSLSVANNRLNSNSEMTYGWNGLNYFNMAGTAGAVAKTNDTPTTAWWHILRFNHGNSAGYYTDLAVPFNDNTLHYKRVSSGTLQNGGWVKVWDAKNSNLSTVDWAAKNITASGSIVSMSTVESRGDNSTGILPQMLWHIPGVTYARIRMANNGTLHVLSGGSEAYQSLYAHGFVAAGNVVAAGTVTATKLVIGGITIDVYNGALRVNGNLVATGGVTAYQ